MVDCFNNTPFTALKEKSFREHTLHIMTMAEPLPSGLPGAGSHQDLLKQLKVFLAGAATASGSRGANPRLAQTALHLLVHLPAARWCLVFKPLLIFDQIHSEIAKGCGL